MKNEPVAIAGAITAALIATVALLGWVLSWEPELVALIDAMLAAWVLVVAKFVRARVSPVVDTSEPM